MLPKYVPTGYLLVIKAKIVNLLWILAHIALIKVNPTSNNTSILYFLIWCTVKSKMSMVFFKKKHNLNLIMRKTDNIRCYQGYGATRTPICWEWECKMVQPLWKSFKLVSTQRLLYKFYNGFICIEVKTLPKTGSNSMSTNWWMDKPVGACIFFTWLSLIVT